MWQAAGRLDGSKCQVLDGEDLQRTLRKPSPLRQLLATPENSVEVEVLEAWRRKRGLARGKTRAEQQELWKLVSSAHQRDWKGRPPSNFGESLSRC